MTARTVPTAASALVLTAALLTGCGGATPPAPVAADPPAPKDTLLAAVPAADHEGAYRFTIKGGQTPLSGVVDARRRTLQATFVQKDAGTGLTMTMKTLVVDRTTWMKFAFEPAGLPGLPKLPKKWLKLDPAKWDDAEEAVEFSDPGYASLLVRNAGQVTTKGAGRFAGTTDLTRATEAEIVTADALTALGDKAKAVPFTAAVDAAGHLTAMTLTIPAAGKAKAATYSVGYSGYGATTAPATPAAGEQTPAPAEVYDLVNG